MQNLLIWGAGGHAAVVADIAELTGWSPVAFVDDSSQTNEPRRFFGRPVINRDAARTLVESGCRSAIVAIGHPRIRLEKARYLESWGCDLPVLIHPAATVARSAEIGSGTIVAANAIVQPLAAVGRFCIVNTAASVDHDCLLMDAVHLCPGARLGGAVQVRDGCWVGIGACVRDKVILGSWAFIGAGAAVVANVANDEMVVGVPARYKGRSPFATSRPTGELTSEVSLGLQV